MRSGNSENLRGPVGLSHIFLSRHLRPADRAVDATCGNGGDTLLLAQLVGERGRVWSFDVDQGAIGTASRRLSEAGCDGVVTFIHDGHENLPQHVDEPVSAVVFNLGYLPRSGRRSATASGTTMIALNHACGMLLPGGIIVVTIYPGHEGGAEEGRRVEEWCSTLPSPDFNVWCGRMLNRSSEAPYLVLIEKSPGGRGRT